MMQRDGATAIGMVAVVMVFAGPLLGAQGLPEDLVERLEEQRSAPVEMVSFTRVRNLRAQPGVQPAPPQSYSTWYRRFGEYEETRLYQERDVSSESESLHRLRYDQRVWRDDSNLLNIWTSAAGGQTRRVSVFSPGVDLDLDRPVAASEPTFRYVTSSRDGTEFVGRLPDCDVVQLLLSQADSWTLDNEEVREGRQVQRWRARFPEIGSLEVALDRGTAALLAVRSERREGNWWMARLPKEFRVGQNDLVLQKVHIEYSVTYDFEADPDLPHPTSARYLAREIMNGGMYENVYEFVTEIRSFRRLSAAFMESAEMSDLRSPGIPTGQRVTVESKPELRFVWDGRTISHDVHAGTVKVIEGLGEVEVTGPIRGVSVAKPLVQRWWFWALLIALLGGVITVLIIRQRKGE